MPWGWKIATYLWTKSASAATILVSAGALALSPSSQVLRVFAPAVALAMLLATLALLVHDLKRPDRFYCLLTKPNLRSWLVLGSYILMAYSLIARTQRFAPYSLLSCYCRTDMRLNGWQRIGQSVRALQLQTSKNPEVILGFVSVGELRDHTPAGDVTIL
jgi:hypothetical protein